jgi:hypothetical protein
MMNPLVVEKMVRLHQEEVLREIEQSRLHTALPKRERVNFAQILETLPRFFKNRVSETNVPGTPRKAGAAEC